METLRSILSTFILEESQPLKPVARVFTWPRTQESNSTEHDRSESTIAVPDKVDESVQPPEQPHVPFEPKRSKPIDIVNPRSLEDRLVAPPLNYYRQPGKPIVMPMHRDTPSEYPGRRGLRN